MTNEGSEMKPEKMTDEDVEHELSQALSASRAAKVRAHIAALTAERDELGQELAELLTGMLAMVSLLAIDDNEQGLDAARRVVSDRDALREQLAKMTAERDEARRIHDANVEAGIELAKEFNRVGGVGYEVDGVFRRAHALLAEVASLRERVKALEAERDERRRAFVSENVRAQGEEDRVQALEADNAALLEALRIATRGRMDYRPGNAPGHAHSVAGVWDDDNVRSGLAGKPCEWCTVEWPRVVAALDAAHPGAARLERLRTLEAQLETEQTRVHNAGVDLSAIRQRAGDARRMAETLPPEKMGLVQRAIDRIVGDDAPEPLTDEEARRLCKEAGVDTAAGLEKCMEMVRATQRPNASEPAPQAETSVEPTTVEAFATVRYALGRLDGYEWYNDNEVDPRTEQAKAALSLLERRMGKMERELDAIPKRLAKWADEARAEGDEDNADALDSAHDSLHDDIRAALTDAPPVFTLEEVVGLMGDVVDPDDVKSAQIMEVVVMRLTAFRRKP